MNSINRCLLKAITMITLLASGAWAAGASSSAARPNILFIIFDDWGGNMLGTMHTSIAGSTWIKTPNFDRVAREGALFKMRKRATKPGSKHRRRACRR